MINRRGTAIGIIFLIFSNKIFVGIIIYKTDALGNHIFSEQQTTSVEEITFTAKKIGELASNLEKIIMKSL
ncbi:MAG: hypothetical protein ACFFA0_10505 [Promethearchaeota archaeon]